MVLCQSVNIPSWKIAIYFPQLISRLNAIENNLDMILEGESPNKDLLPILSKHWNEISLEEAEDCIFQGENLLESWIVIGQENVELTEVSDGKKAKGRKKAEVKYNWEARTPSDCIIDLKTLCNKLQENLNTRYVNIVPSNVETFSKMFDLGELVSELSKFKFQNEKLLIGRNDRITWERKGLNEFNEYYEHICQLPHVQKYVDENLTSNLLPHYSQTIFTKFKTTLRLIVWENFGGETHEIFRTQKGDIVSEFKTSQLFSFQ